MSEGAGQETLVAPKGLVALGHPPRATSPRPRIPRGYETVDSILLTEPRIEALRRELQAILSVVQLESGGAPVEVDGFRLRDPAQWADYPTSLSSIFWHLSSVCNFSCEFCYEKGNPPDFPIQSLRRMASEAEIETRLRLYDPVGHRGLFTVRTAINEPFANKRALQFLRKMRERSPHELLSFVTNGSYLTEEVVASLVELGPMFFNLSIYSTDSAIRRSVLADHRPDRAVKAVRLLARHCIPYMSNLVMWPSIPFSDMERTIAYMAEHRATLVRVCLGGYSRYLPGEFRRFEVSEYWPRVVAEVERLRDAYPIPLLIEPSSYVRQDTEAAIDGVVRGSPAEQAGIRQGDKVLAVNGAPIRTRVQLASELRRSGREAAQRYRPPGVIVRPDGGGEAGPDRVALTLERAGQRFERTLDRFESRAMAEYPYAQIARFDDFMFGLVITDSLRYSSLKAARDKMSARGARRVLILTSALIEPILGQMLNATQAFDGFEVVIRVARNQYFGGTINIGDLLVVEDFIGAVNEHRAAGPAPDLILIPSSPFASSPWGRDLTGRPWQDIERAVGIPVELVECSNLTH